MLISEQPLKDRWNEFRAEKPKTRIRDAALQMGVTCLLYTSRCV